MTWRRDLNQIGDEPQKKGLKEVGGDESKIFAVYGKLQSSLFVVGALVAKYAFEGEGFAGEGWKIELDVIAAICTEFSEAVSEAIVKSI